MVDGRIDVGKKAVLIGCRARPGGACSVNLMLTMALMPLKPYFQGTIRRSGAPFWFGSVLP
jgi:hypothetical protein